MTSELNHYGPDMPPDPKGLVDRRLTMMHRDGVANAATVKSPTASIVTTPKA